jgi:hypothetical protein
VVAIVLTVSPLAPIGHAKSAFDLLDANDP